MNAMRNIMIMFIISISVALGVDAQEIGMMIDSEPTINADVTSYEPSALLTKQNLVNSQYLVGEIGCEEGVCSTGGKFYTIPIETAEYAKFMKPISLNYDSQLSAQMAGLRWWIGGLSTIDVVSKTYNYDGLVAPADLSNLSTCAFSLDGVRLIRKSESELEFEGASGFTKVTAIESNGNVTGFLVRFPNGQTAFYSSMRTNGMWYQFPIKELSDRFGNKIFYNYVESGNQFYISSILYGGLDAGSCFGRIEFDYGQSNSENIKYNCGIKIIQNLLLKKIVSKVKINNEWKELRTYNLNHDGDNQLTEIGCRVGNKELPPLHFDYGQWQSGIVNLTSERALFSNVSGALPQSTQLIRGKFLSGAFEDGMIVVTKEYNPYQLKADYTYGSSMPADQDIYVYTGISVNSKPFSIKAGSGFQSVCAADVDGDGVDEIILTNSNRKDKNTIFHIAVYKANYDGTYTINSYDYTIGQVYKDDLGNLSPVQTIPYWGDFDGDGSVDMLLAIIENPSNMQPEFRFVNLSRTPYTMDKVESEIGTIKEFEKIQCLDSDGDGKSELLCIYGTTMKKFLFQWNRLTEAASVKLPIDMKYKDYIFWGDVNGDGKQDMLIPKSISYLDVRTVDVPIWAPAECPLCGGADPIIGPVDNCRYCKSNLKSYYVKNGCECRLCGRELEFGVSPTNPAVGTLLCPKHEDMLVSIELHNYVDNGSGWFVGLSTGVDFDFTEMPIGCFENVGACSFADINNDMLCDVLLEKSGTLYAIINNDGVLDFKNAIAVERRYVGNRLVMPANLNDVGVSGFITLQKVGTDLKAMCYNAVNGWRGKGLVETFTNSFGVRSVNYYTTIVDRNVCEYQKESLNPAELIMVAPIVVLSELLRYNENGLGTDNVQIKYKNAIYNKQGKGFRGFRSIRNFDNLQNGTTIIEYVDLDMPSRRESSNRCDKFIYTKLGNRGGAFEDYAVKAIESLDKSNGAESVTNYLYDIYGNVLTSEKKYLGNATISESTKTMYETVITPSIFVSDLVTQTETKSLRNGDVWIEKNTYKYDGNLLPLSTTKYAGKDGASIISTTFWEYDKYGNILTEAVEPYNSGFKTTKVHTYSLDGIFEESVTDENGVVVKFSDYNIWGEPSVETDGRGNSKSRKFDELGRLLVEQQSSGVEKVIAYEWSDMGTYSVKTQTSDAPEKMTVFDASNRQIKIADMRFNGKWRYVDVVYDRLGRKVAESLPYIGETASSWNHFEYDIFNRPISQTEASGKTTTWSYDGMAVTEEVNNIVKTTVYDEVGLPISETDLGGEIKYLYRADKQLSAVVAPNSIVTEIGYDDAGRRIAITDPSFGERRYSYSYKDGNLYVTETDADNKSIVTCRDLSGRTLSVNRPEFNTTYAYNAYGELHSIKSTNSTSTSYLYDKFGRLSGIRENAPDNIYLLRRFYYDELGKLVTETVSAKGSKLKISYGYLNGTRNKIILNDSINAWLLKTENTLGQISGTVSNGLPCKFEYTEFGIPSTRQFGRALKYNYDFDVHTGNLLSREDAIRNMVEHFSYDGLNRLTDDNGLAVEYDKLGNITNRDNLVSAGYNNSPGVYQTTKVVCKEKDILPNTQIISYTSFCRPDSIFSSAAIRMSSKTSTQGLSDMDFPAIDLKKLDSCLKFVYNHNGDRVLAYGNNGGVEFKNYYLGNIYECDVKSGNERFCIAGTSTTAPLVYAKVNNEWQLYNICRDYLGSVMGIVNSKHTLVAEYSYDAWGRFLNPNTLKALPKDSISPMFGRGFCGHEYLREHRLYVMNARLYDPVLARFLSPDPFVQAPDYTQSLNRYAYAFNNPFSFTDPDGEFILAAIAGFWRGVFKHRNVFSSMWKSIKNSAMIYSGLFAVDKNKSLGGKIMQFVSRFSWEFPQTAVGEFFSLTSNVFGDVDVVKHYRGATYVVREDANKSKGVTLGSFINIWDEHLLPRNAEGKFSFSDDVVGDNSKYMYMHEYGHYLQSQIFGPVWLLSHGIPSLVSAIKSNFKKGYRHREYWTERDANRRANGYFQKFGVINEWEPEAYPL